ncbi:MAG: sigma-70 family RNA polymerase sigma factor [Planctomycetia bacterium]|nr:sigma-70 family RNA polymerase sigma factor [Planctomycetia bacterium]
MATKAAKKTKAAQATEIDKDKQEKANQLFMQYYPFVRHLALISAPSPDLQDDIVNDVYIRFIRSCERYDLDKGITELLRTITTNCAHDYWKKHLQTHSPKFVQLSELVGHELELIDKSVQTENLDDESVALTQCIGNLTPRSRELVEMHYFEDIPIVEIAEIKKISLTALYKTFLRIRVAIKDCVQRVLRAGGARV